MLCDSVLEEECQKVLLHSINGHLRSSLFYDYLLVSDVLDINDLLDTRSLGMYSACMAPHFPALLCSVYRHCSFPRCYTSHCVCPSLNCVFPTALCRAQITSVVSNKRCPFCFDHTHLLAICPISDVSYDPFNPS